MCGMICNAEWGYCVELEERCRAAATGSSSTGVHLQEAMCLQLAQYGCLLSGMLQDKWAHMISTGQRARLPVQQGLALCGYDLTRCASTAAYLQVQACLSTAAHMTL